MHINQFTAPISPAGNRLSCALDLLLINLGSQCFGLPLSEVRHVCTMPPSFAAYGPETKQHFVFQDNPLPYVSLWNLLDLKSEYAEYEEILNLLPKRRQDHLDWMDALENAIRNGTAFSKARNPRECAFGKWYYAYQAKTPRLSLMLRHFEKPHMEIHRLADKLLGLAETGQAGHALLAFEKSKNTTLAELLELFDSTQELVEELQRRIAVIVADGDDACALGADSVRAIVAVPPERIKPGLGMGAQATPALIVLDDHTLAPLINWRTFLSTACVEAVISEASSLNGA